GPRVLRLHTVTDAEFRDCWAAIKLMRSVWRQRPRMHAEPVRSGASLVTEFELAIAAGDSAAARQALAELRRRGLLSAENLRFLEIRLLGADGRWNEISGSADLSDVARVRRPWLVTEDLLTALYRTRLARFEEMGDVASAIGEMARLSESLPGLFSGRGPLRSPDVLKVYALRHALPSSADTLRIRELANEPPLTSSDERWLTAVADSIDKPQPPDRTAHDALLAGDLDAAFRLAQVEPSGRAQAELLIECAFELQTLGAAEVAIRALDALPDSDRSALLERRMISGAAAHIRALVTRPTDNRTDPPHTWTEWLKRLLEHPDWPAAQAVAVCGELEYSADDLSEPETADALPALVLAVAESEQRQVLRDALPRIIGWLERQELDLSSARPVHEAILTAIAFDASRGASSLEAAYNATEALLRAGVDEPGYIDILDRLELVWDRMASRAYVSWLCDLFELFSMYPGSREQLIRFAVTATGPVLGFARQLDRESLKGLADLVAGLGGRELADQLDLAGESAIEVEAVADILAGRLVGIYTLTPQVAVRARDEIERRFPGVRVQIDSSLASTSSLEHLAAVADYLIVSIRSAKHAATDAIDRHRPRELPTIIPRGRGSSRMVEALVEAVASPALSIG
ncbi:MAG: protein DpdD, partial [Solirubrobacteraceae bacterium]